MKKTDYSYARDDCGQGFKKPDNDNYSYAYYKTNEGSHFHGGGTGVTDEGWVLKRIISYCGYTKLHVPTNQTKEPTKTDTSIKNKTLEKDGKNKTLRDSLPPKNKKQLISFPLRRNTTIAFVYEYLQLELLRQKELRMPADPQKWKSIIDIIETLPEDQKTGAMVIFNNFVTQVQALTEPETPPALLSPLETLKQNYTQFPQELTMSADNVLKHLKNELEDYVTYFKKVDEDLIYMDQFRAVEPRAESIYRRLWKASSKDTSIPKLTSIIPKKKVRVKKENDAKIQAIQEMESLKTFLLHSTKKQAHTHPHYNI